MQELLNWQNDLPLSVLIVEDDELQADFLSLLLEHAGCTVRTVEDGSAALGAVLENPFQMLVIDWQLPGIDGIELTRRLRRSNRDGSYMHIVMMTARDDATIIREAMEAGADDFLFKPFEPIDLEFAIGSARRNLRLHRQLERRNRMVQEAHRETRSVLSALRTDLDAAAALHRRLLPQDGKFGRLEVSTIYHSAMQLGGDSIGVCELPNGGTLFFIIDVCGHGVPAALESFHIHHRLKGLAPSTPADLSRAVAALNREILSDAGDSYATLICGVVMPDAGCGWLVRAGHPPMLLAKDGSIASIEEGGAFPIGWFDNADFPAIEFAFEPGSALVIQSDGFSDFTGEHFDQSAGDPLRALLAQPRSSILAERVAELDARLAEMSGSSGAADDISVLAIRFCE